MRTLLFFGWLTLLGNPAFAGSAPFVLEQGLIWIDVYPDHEAKSRPLQFILDTGAEETVIDTQTARELGWKLESREWVQGVGGSTAAYRTASERLTCAGQAVEKAFLSVDFSSVTARCGKQVDGLLGADYFHGRVLKIDYAAGTLTALPEAPARKNAQLLPIVQNYGAMCVAVRVGGDLLQKVRIDTGSSDSLHWSPSHANFRRQRLGSSIGFSASAGSRSTQIVHLGDKELGKIQTFSHPTQIFEGEDGLLGNALLQRFTVTIDMPGARLILEDPDQE